MPREWSSKGINVLYRPFFLLFFPLLSPVTGKKMSYEIELRKPFKLCVKRFGFRTTDRSSSLARCTYLCMLRLGGIQLLM